MNRLSPAAEIIDLCGGVRATARILGLNPSAVSRWAMPPEKKGTGGVVPQRHWAAILDHAKQQKLKITLRDLAKL